MENIPAKLRIVCPRPNGISIQQLIEQCKTRLEQKPHTGPRTPSAWVILFPENALACRFDKTQDEMMRDLQPLQAYLKGLQPQLEVVVAFSAFVRHAKDIDHWVVRSQKLGARYGNRTVPQEYAYNMGYLVTPKKIANAIKRMQAPGDWDTIAKNWDPEEADLQNEVFQKRGRFYKDYEIGFPTYTFGDGSTVELRVCKDTCCFTRLKTDWVSIVPGEQLPDRFVSDFLSNKRRAIVINDGYVEENLSRPWVPREPAPNVWTTLCPFTHEKFGQLTNIEVEMA